MYRYTSIPFRSTVLSYTADIALEDKFDIYYKCVSCKEGRSVLNGILIIL